MHYICESLTKNLLGWPSPMDDINILSQHWIFAGKVSRGYFFNKWFQWRCRSNGSMKGIPERGYSIRKEV